MNCEGKEVGERDKREGRIGKKAFPHLSVKQMHVC